VVVVVIYSGIVVDQNQALRFALDIARGMEFLHNMEPMVPNMRLSSKHILVSEHLDPILTSRLNYHLLSHPRPGLISPIIK